MSRRHDGSFERAVALGPIDAKMFTDARTLRDYQQLDADICVAGAGAAGITLARALAGSGLSVLMLESGGTEPESKTQALYEGRSIGQEYWALHTSRLRYLGGSTNHWTGWCRPLDPIDFEARPGMLGGWPIDYDELLPYYSLAQADCDLDSFEYDARVWSERYQVPLMPVAGHGWETVTWQFSPPTRFGEKYRDWLTTSQDVRVLLNANLSHIALHKSGGSVERCLVRCLNGPRLGVTARAFVLALGGLENPRVLLASSDVNPAGVGNRHGAVGRYFSDHPHSVVGQLLLGNGRSTTAYMGTFRPGDGTSIRFSWALDEDVRRTRGLPGMSVTLDPYAYSQTLDQAAQGVGSLLEQLGTPSGKSNIGLFLRAEQPPNPDSRLRLDDDRDALGMPRLVLDWRVPRTLHDRISEGMRLLAQALGQNSIGRLQSFAHAATKPNNAWPTLWGGHHHVGTTRMSEDPRYGVVDSNCRLHEVDNLYCAGSSTFATAGYANPTLTICALARRLAAYLRRRYA